MFIKLKIEHHETVVGSIYKKIILKWGNGTLFGFNSQPVCIVKNEKQIWMIFLFWIGVGDGGCGGGTIFFYFFLVYMYI
jgi:hypothetical protein